MLKKAAAEAGNKEVKKERKKERKSKQLIIQANHYLSSFTGQLLNKLTSW